MRMLCAQKRWKAKIASDEVSLVLKVVDEDKINLPFCNICVLLVHFPYMERSLIPNETSFKTLFNSYRER
jgi:hypothetical protein